MEMYEFQQVGKIETQFYRTNADASIVEYKSAISGKWIQTKYETPKLLARKHLKSIGVL